MEISREEFMKVWFDRLWNRNDPMEQVRAAFDEYWCSECEVGGMGGKTLAQTEAVLGFVEAFRGAFADIHFELYDFVEHAPWITHKIRGTMTHRPSGRAVTLEGCVTARIEGGKIREATNFIDFVPILEQIGAIAPNSLMLALQNQPVAMEPTVSA